MRKNGINRELTVIDGGVCAPSGFFANAVYYGEDNQKSTAFGLVVAERRCPTACVFSLSNTVGAPLLVSKKHLKDGYAQAVVFNSGIANVFQQNGEILAEEVCSLLSKEMKIDVADVLIASTGEIGIPLNLRSFQKSIPPLVKGIGRTNTHGETVARALQTNDRQVKQLSYSFDLSGVPCKIGVAFKGNSCVCPNMATVLGVITTDVKISPFMLQKALSSETKETFNLLNVDGISSPNDMICIMANGNAGNYIIDAPDGEYKKFCMILREVAMRMCKAIIADDGKAKRLICVVCGAKSKQVSSSIAKAIISCEKIKNGLLKGEVDIKSLLYAIVGLGVKIPLSDLQISVCSKEGAVIVMEENVPLPIAKEYLAQILKTEEVELRLDFKKGNYASTAFGRF